MPPTRPVSNTDIVMTRAVRAQQELRGSRAAMARWEDRGGFREDRDEELWAFAAQRDSLYLGTANAAGQPYIQHRGGPRGFLRWIGGRRLGFAEYPGNRQYISFGNLSENPRATLFLMDYANRVRVKVWGRAEVVEDDASALAVVGDADHPTPERAIVFHVEAWDMNCPSHIPVLLPADAVEESLSALRKRIASLESELAAARVAHARPHSQREEHIMTNARSTESPTTKSSPRALVPPFTLETATAKVRAAEDAWNSRDPERVSLAYSPDSEWRNRDTFVRGRDEIRAFLAGKWSRELDYRLTKSLWSFGDDRIAVRFQYEWHDADGRWFRAYGNELWEFDADGLMRRREASINDVAIPESERRFHWPAPGPRPIDDEGIPSVR